MFKEGIVLAAGMGTRFGGLPKFSLKLAGRPLIEYGVLIMAKAGIRRIVFVVSEKYAELASEYASKLPVEVDIVVNEKPHSENGYSFALGARSAEEFPVLLTMVDHLFCVDLLRRASSKRGDLVVVGDRDPKYVNIHEATKILAESSKVKKIGKDLREYTHVDTGVFSVGRKFADYCIRRAREGSSLSELIQEAVENGLDILVAEVSGAYWTDIDTPNDLEEVLTGKRRIVLERVKKDVFGS